MSHDDTFDWIGRYDATRKFISGRSNTQEEQEYHKFRRNFHGPNANGYFKRLDHALVEEAIRKRFGSFTAAKNFLLRFADRDYNWVLFKEIAHIYEELERNKTINQAEKETETMTAKGTLFQFKHPTDTNVDVYGEFLTTNSKGQLVLEIKGTNEVVAVDKNLCEEVMPYTVSVRFHNDSQDYHYLYEGTTKLEVDDVVLKTDNNDNQLVFVTGVDTKSKKATKHLVGFRMSKGAKL